MALAIDSYIYFMDFLELRTPPILPLPALLILRSPNGIGLT
jgi:hypothetical protein